MRAQHIILIASLAVLVSACSDFYSMAPRSTLKAVGNLSIVSTGLTMATDKTLTDHLVSYNTGKDCSTLRIEQGRTYCKEDEPNPVASVSCYPSIGDVTCYSEPNPARKPDERLGTRR